MAHDTKSVGPSRDKHRVAGLRGLQAVVRKTVSDDLQVCTNKIKLSHVRIISLVLKLMRIQLSLIHII